MKFDLAAQVRRPSKRPIVLPPIVTTGAQRDALASLYLQVVRAWEAGSPAIVESYAQSLAQVLQTDSIDQTGGSIDDLSDLVQRLIVQLQPDLRNWAVGMEQWHRGKWQRGVLSTTGLDLSTQLSATDVDDTVGASIQWNTSLIKDLSDETRRRISNAVFTSFRDRLPARDLAKQIRDIAAMGRRRSVNIAADQTTKLGGRLNQARQEQAGLNKFKWRHSGKLHPRPWHKARDGEIFSWDDPELKGDLPSQAPFCGCTGQGVIIFEDDEPVTPPPPKPPTARQQQAAIAKAEQQARTYVVARGKETGREHLVAYDARTGEELHRLAGGRDYVVLSEGLNRDIEDASRAIVLHHNHPSSSSFSREDINVLTENPGMRAIWAHGHNGSDFLAERGELAFKMATYRAIGDALREKIQALINAGVLSVDEASMMHHHLVWLKIHKLGQIRYTATLRDTSLEVWNRNEALWKRLLGDET